MSRKKLDKPKADTKEPRKKQFTDNKTSNKQERKLLPAPKEPVNEKTSTTKEYESTPKNTNNITTKTTPGNSQNTNKIIEHQDMASIFPHNVAVVQKPTSIEVDVINDTTKVKHQRQKIRLTLTLLVLFYIIGILLGGGILYRIDIQNTNKTDKPTSVTTQTQTPTEQQNTNLKNNTLDPKIQNPLPQITANAYGIFYKPQKSSQFLQIADQNADKQLPPASISKLMTALLIVEKYPLNKQITFPARCQNIADGSNAGYKAGDILSIQDLLYGMLVASGADASCALSTIDENINFISEMNKKAQDLNMTNTKFQNAIGFDAGNEQVSSVNDLIILINEILKYNTIRKIVGTEVVEIKPQNTATVYRITSTNDLLKTIPGTIGIKTGSTPLAGECLAYLYEEKNSEILIIILGSQKRFEDTQILLNWAKKQEQLD